MRSRNTPGMGGSPLRGTPSRERNPTLSGTPPFGGPARIIESSRAMSLSGKVLLWLALFQGLLFLLPVASPSSRLLGIAMAIGTFLAARLLRNSARAQIAVVSGLALLIVVNFVLHLMATTTGFPFRLWQVAVLVGYATVFFAQFTALTGLAGFATALIGWGGLAALLLVAEAVIGGPDSFRRTSGNVEWVGASDQESAGGARFAPNSVVRSIYPDNPRGYFDEPDALQSRWVLRSQEGSNARLDFPADRNGVLRINISDTPGKVAWHIALNQAPIYVQADERYEVRFRARADSARTIFVAVGQAHAPWSTLGLYREVRVDTAWKDVAQTFRATAIDRNAQLYFNLGAEHPSVELSSITMRAISTNREVQSEARRERSVSYQINSLGCRGMDYPEQRTNSDVWRILALGDGNTFGVGVHQRDTYASRLEALLNELAVRRDTAARYDVINCGVRGFSTQDERQLFDLVGARYAPNVVLLSVSPDDDRFTIADSRTPSEVPRFWLARVFRVWGFVNSLRKPKPATPDYASVVSGIKQLDASVRARGARLAIVLFQHRLGADWVALDSALSVGLRGTDIPRLDLGPVLLPFGEQKLMVHSVYDTHPNELAHRVSAEALRKFLADQGLLGDKGI